jgi:hypothetical protein
MAFSEGTPLVSQATAGNALDNVNRMVSKMFTHENIELASTAANDKLKALQKQVRDGDFSIRLAALVAGLTLVASAGFGFMGLVLSFHVTNAILEFYTFVLGFIMLALESRGFVRQQAASSTQQTTLMETCYRNVFKYAYFLKFVAGRGGLYVVAGSLQLAQHSFVDHCVGGFVMIVGVLYIVVGHDTAQKLQKLRQSLSEQTLRSKFTEADTDGNGTLSLDNFKVLVDHLGIPLSRREREVAFLTMDLQDKGAVSFEEFQAWWAVRDEDGYA